MNPEYKIINADERLVERFLKTLSRGAASFRYFNKRPVSSIHNHLITIVIVNKFDCPVAYGHLEKENNVVWLGVAVADDYVNKGLGKLIMKYLIHFSKSIKEPVIYLSVDHNNFVAQNLYTGLGFIKTKDFKSYGVFELRLI